MCKILILLTMFGFMTPVAVGRADVIENPQNIQITVKTRQASFQHQGGAQTTSQSAVIASSGQPMEIGGNISNSEFDGTFYRGASG